LVALLEIKTIEYNKSNLAMECLCCYFIKSTM